MAKTSKDQEREERIENEIVVDAYGEKERSMSWWIHLNDNLVFPFKARCRHEVATSPLQVGESVQVTGMPDEETCADDMFVNLRWQNRTLAVPLSQLEPVGVDEDTLQAVEDWHYWVEQGYGF